MAEGSERGETLTDFLDRAALVSDSDDFDENALITLMTLHSAKGLEFDHVFLTGMEEGIFPRVSCRRNKDAVLSSSSPDHFATAVRKIPSSMPVRNT